MKIEKSRLVVPFPGAITALLNRVGGKGQSLIRMTQVGLPVPPGFILTVDFFRSWLDELRIGDEWKQFLASKIEDLESNCELLKSRALSFEFDAGQIALIEESITALSSDRLLAVRSSSPAEDLVATSFAGGYETILGVRHEELFDAIKQVFISALDYRVLVYKLKHGFDIKDLGIAVIVQEQLRSDIAGVAFSLNPLNNDFDEIVISANWGLGETVVDGSCSPDTYLVEKHSMRILSREPGRKETRSFLADGGEGGVRRESGIREAELCLSDGHVLSITRQIKSLEEVFRFPVDVEWAIENDKEYILQTRPITAYVPLPSALITAPGARRNLYCDVTLSVQGIERPLSTMGLSIIECLSELFISGRISTTFDSNHKQWPWLGKKAHFKYISRKLPAMVILAEGKIYAVLSNYIQALGKERVVDFLRNVDPVVANSLEQADDSLYQKGDLLANFLPLLALSQIIPSLGRVLDARMFPASAHERAQRRIEQFKKNVDKIALSRDSVIKVTEKVLKEVHLVIRDCTAPIFMASRFALERMKQTARGAPLDLIADLELAMPYNVTINMGLSLFDLSRYADELPLNNNPSNEISGEMFLPAFETNMSESFRSRWKDFLHEYGHRGPLELDVRSPRFRELPGLLVSQLHSLSARSNSENVDTRERYEQNCQRREQAFARICNFIESGNMSDSMLRDRVDAGAAARESSARASRLKRFKSLYRVWITLGGYRETHKYLMIYGLAAIRERLLKEGERLTRVGRLDDREQIFDLSYAELRAAQRSKKSDLRELVKDNNRFTAKLAGVKNLPALFDSRGRILTLKRQDANGDELQGVPISRGLARCRARVLHSPFGISLEPGDILVARATDPGWTPLFATVAAVVLEVGGLLQHGALVAREYGLPCVAGVFDATTIIEDGAMIEVDGNSGLVRILT